MKHLRLILQLLSVSAFQLLPLSAQVKIPDLPGGQLTGAATDKANDRIPIWDHSANTTKWQTIGDLVNIPSMFADLPAGSIAPSKIGQSGAASGQVMTWNGSAWGPSAIPDLTNDELNAAIAEDSAATLAALGAATELQGAKADIAGVGIINPAADIAGAPAFAYALERMVSSYVGACVKVRRSSDNAEADIGFLIDGRLDTVSLLQHCGSGDGFVRTWYDQSGNARHLQQSTTTKQFQIVSSGALVTLNGKPSMDVVAANSQNMLTASSFDLTGTTSAVLSAVFSADTISGTVLCDHSSGANYTTGGFGVFIGNFGSGRIEVAAGSASAATRLVNYVSGMTSGQTNALSATIDPSRSTSDSRIRIRWNAADQDEAQTGVVGTLSTGCFKSGTLAVGSASVSNGYFDGKISQIALFTAPTMEKVAAVETQAMVAAGLSNPFIAAPSTFDETGAATPDADFVRTSAFANTTWTTRATVLKIQHTNDIYTSYPQYADLVVNVDGAFYQQIVAGANGLGTSTVFLPAGNKTIEIVCGLQSRPGVVGSTVFGMFPISFASNAPMERVTVSQSNRLVIYGDSISVGGNTSIAARDGWAMKIRSAAPYPVGVEGFGFRALNDDCSDSTARAAFVAKIVAWNPAKLWIAIGSNDYGLNRWSAASFGTAYAALLDDLHAALPSMAIYCQTPVVRATENANGSGSTLGDYRTQISTAVSSRSAWATLVDGTAIMTTGSLVDGVHPGDAGHVLFANYVKTVLGIP